MLSITYVSVATRAMTDEDVASILRQSRRNNLRLGLTGALLYHGGRFIQVLEGPAAEVTARFAAIEADPRHSKVQTISEKQIGARQFPNWTMGFRPLDDEAVNGLAGFDDFFNSHAGKARLTQADNEAQQLLRWLVAHWMPGA